MQHHAQKTSPTTAAACASRRAAAARTNTGPGQQRGERKRKLNVSKHGHVHTIRGKQHIRQCRGSARNQVCKHSSHVHTNSSSRRHQQGQFPYPTALRQCHPVSKCEQSHPAALSWALPRAVRDTPSSATQSATSGRHDSCGEKPAQNSCPCMPYSTLMLTSTRVPLGSLQCTGN